MEISGINSSLPFAFTMPDKDDSGSTPAADSTASSEATQPAAEQTVLNVYAAASLTETFGELEKTFEAANPGVDVRFTVDGDTLTVREVGEYRPEHSASETA